MKKFKQRYPFVYFLAFGVGGMVAIIFSIVAAISYFFLETLGMTIADVLAVILGAWWLIHQFSHVDPHLDKQNEREVKQKIESRYPLTYLSVVGIGGMFVIIFGLVAISYFFFRTHGMTVAGLFVSLAGAGWLAFHFIKAYP